jgi:LDH2 family malate/lactate/ureidoglycolate dehydrogenase
MTVTRYPSEGLHRFMADVLGRLGMTADDAALGAEVLHDADLAGVDTHGIVNFPTHPHYVAGLRNGFVDPQGAITVLRDSPVAAAWDSGRALGPVVAHRAMEAAIAKAQASGIGMVTVRDGRHFGANGYFAEMAAGRGLLAMVVANTPVAAFPPGGRTPVVGTNPFAFAAPVGHGPPLVVDIAMTAVSGSKVMAASRAGRSIPEGWLVDAGGNPTTDPDALWDGGGLELLGGPIAGHKGYGLALMVDVLGILAGNGSGLWQAPASWTQGQWFAAWRADLFLDPEDFQAQMQRMAGAIHGVPTQAGATALLPGERRAASRAQRARRGVPIDDDVVAQLQQVASETGVPFPGKL